MATFATLVQIAACALVGASAIDLARADEPPEADPLREVNSLIEARRAAEARSDGEGAARASAGLSAQALERARRVHEAWMGRRNAQTGLFPQSPSNGQFNYRNAAADFLCYQYSFALDRGASSAPLLMQTLDRERKLNPAGVNGGLCRAVDSKTGALIEQPMRERMFATSEYLKDGLTPLYERHELANTLDRMVKLADAIIAASAVKTSGGGVIPSRDSEINGNVLQAFSRLGYFAKFGGEGGGERFHEFAARVGEAVIGQMLPRTGGVPVRFYDYQTDRFPTGVVRLRDHGNETAVGLSEVFAVAVARSSEPVWAARAERWSGPLATMYETLLTRGVNADGLLVSALDGGGGYAAAGKDGGGEASGEGEGHARKPQPSFPLKIVDAEPCDNWGYLLTGAILYVQAEERRGKQPRERLDALLRRVDAIALAVTRTANLRWEGDEPDGMADAIESAVYVAAARPGIRAKLLDWADAQVVHLYRRQRADGFVCDSYLDGNIIRTLMQYADARSGGLRLTPPNLSGSAAIGFASAPDPTIVVIAGAQGCKASLIDPAECCRGLPWDWARINSWPRWQENRSAAVVLDLGPNQRRVISSRPEAKAEVSP